MSLLSLPIYLVVGCVEWYLSLRRTLACARGERAILITIVFIENILGLWVLSNFIHTNDWIIAISYSIGGSAGAYLVSRKQGKAKSNEESRWQSGPTDERRAN